MGQPKSAAEILAEMRVELVGFIGSCMLEGDAAELGRAYCATVVPDGKEGTKEFSSCVNVPPRARECPEDWSDEGQPG